MQIISKGCVAPLGLARSEMLTGGSASLHRRLLYVVPCGTMGIENLKSKSKSWIPGCAGMTIRNACEGEEVNSD